MQEVYRAFQMRLFVEHRAGMSRAVNHIELRVESDFLVRALQLMRLIDRHLRILVAVQQQQRRILGVDEEYRARKFRQFRNRFRLAAE